MKHFSLSVYILLIILASFSPGCNDKSIDPIEDGTGIFSFYGAIDLNEHPNYVRVRDLKIPFLSEPDSLDAEVTLLHLESGIQSTLEDSIVTFSGKITNNYIITDTLLPRNTYKLSAMRKSDGATSSSIATMPGITEHTVSPDSNVDCHQPITFRFKNVLPSENIRIEAGFVHDKQITWFEVGRICDIRQTGDNEMVFSASPNNLLGIVFPPPGINMLVCKDITPAVECDQLDSNVARLRYVHFGPEWNAVYPLRPVNPTAVLDVDNGLGFFGGIRRDSFTFTID